MKIKDENGAIYDSTGTSSAKILYNNMKKLTILLLLIVSIAGCKYTSSKTKNEEQPIWGGWHKLTITPAGDTVIYNNIDASHRSVIVDSKSRTLLIDLGQEQIPFDIDTIKDVDGEFELTLKYSKEYSDDTTSIVFKCKPISPTQAIWCYYGFTELLTCSAEHYKVITEKYISPMEAVRRIENREELFDHYIFEFDIDSIFDIDNKRCTLLRLACEKGYEDAIEKLIRRGCNVNKRDNGDSTPLMAATYNKRTGIMRLLIDAGADVNARDTVEGISTALIFACYNGDMTAAQILVDAGAVVNCAAEMQHVITYSVLSSNTELTKLMAKLVKDKWLDGKYK